MTTLTPGCDPDMSTTGAPFGHISGGPRVLSGLVLLAVVAGAALLAVGDSVPGLVVVPAVVVGGLCAVALVARGVRLAQRAGALATASVHRSQPVPTATP